MRPGQASDGRASGSECHAVATFERITSRGVVAVVALCALAGCSPTHTGSVTGTVTGTVYLNTPSASASPTTTTTLLTRTGATQGSLVEHIWGTQSILVPNGWAEHDTIPGGSSDIVAFVDPHSPAQLVITINACALCGTSLSGPPYAPEPQNYLPSTGVTATYRLSPDRLAYSQTSSVPGYETNGLIVDLYSGTNPVGTTTAAVTLPPNEKTLATIILDSLKT